MCVLFAPHTHIRINFKCAILVWRELYVNKLTIHSFTHQLTRSLGSGNTNKTKPKWVSSQQNAIAKSTYNQQRSHLWNGSLSLSRTPMKEIKNSKSSSEKKEEKKSPIHVCTCFSRQQYICNQPACLLQESWRNVHREREMRTVVFATLWTNSSSFFSLFQHFDEQTNEMEGVHAQNRKIESLKE